MSDLSRLVNSDVPLQYDCSDAWLCIPRSSACTIRDVSGCISVGKLVILIKFVKKSFAQFHKISSLQVVLVCLLEFVG